MPVRSLNSSVLKWPDAKLVEREIRCWVKNIKNYHPEIIRVGYFGSYARGDWGVGSDLDLIVIIIGSFQLQKKETLNWDLNKLSVPVDLFVYTKEEWEVLKENKGRFYQTLMREAIWLYPKDNKDKIILDLAIEVKNKLKEKFKNNLVSVCLFGSAARKTLRKGSDIDFLKELKAHCKKGITTE